MRLGLWYQTPTTPQPTQSRTADVNPFTSVNCFAQSTDSGGKHFSTTNYGGAECAWGE